MEHKSVVTRKITSFIQKNNLTIYKLSKLMNVSDSALYAMVKGDTAFSPNFIEKICPILRASKDEFQSWIIADKYSIESIQIAINELENRKEETLILTKNIDTILLEKNFSRTKLSKLINCSQSGFNRIVIGKETMSKSVISRIAPILEISEATIIGWIIADKFKLDTLKLALKTLQEQIK